MEKFPTFRMVFDRKKIADETTRGEITLEINYKKRRKFISTKIYVFPNQWKYGQIVNHPKMTTKNQELRDMMDKYKAVIELAIRNDPNFNLKDFSFSKRKGILSGNFIEYVAERIEQRKDIREITRKGHRKILPALIEFELIEYFCDLTKANILKFDEWLHTKCVCQATIYTYHKVLKTYIHDAILHDKLNADPYLGIKLDKGKSKGRKYLTEKEIAQLSKCEKLPKTLECVRDMFIFQCYTGLAYSDMASFDAANLIERNGKYVFLDRRVKTEEEFYLVLLSPALTILKKYNFKLPVITNQQYNMRLKAVAAIAGLNKKITSHMARHSFAVMCLNKGLSMESVAKMMGHSNTNTTHIYAKLLDKTLERDFAFLEDSL